MEEQSDTASCIGIEAESITVSEKLRDIAREDRNEECRDDPAESYPPAYQHDKGQAEGDLHDTGGQYHEVRVERHPRRNLSAKRLTRPEQVTQTGEHQERTEQNTCNRLHRFIVHPVLSDQEWVPVMLTNQLMPNLSVSMPKVSPHGAFSSPIVCFAPTTSLSQ